MRIYYQRQKCSPYGLVSGEVLCQYSSGFAGEVVSNETAVVENASLLVRSLNLSYKVPHLALHRPIEIYTASRGFPATARLLY